MEKNLNQQLANKQTNTNQEKPRTIYGNIQLMLKC